MPRGLDFKHLSLMQRALRGEPQATKQYCGNYFLIQRISNGRLYRCRGKAPDEFRILSYYDGKSIFDDEGYLLDQFWMLPRIIDGKEE
ncbi:MAG: hypothetical protein ABWY25_11475 [Paenisporosarcina sp.]